MNKLLFTCNVHKRWAYGAMADNEGVVLEEVTEGEEGRRRKRKGKGKGQTRKVWRAHNRRASGLDTCLLEV